MCNKITPLVIQLEDAQKYQQSQCDRIAMLPDCRLFKLSRTKRQEFPQIFHSLLGVRRTVKSSTAAVVAGSLHPDKKPLSAELRRYQGFGVYVALLHLGFDVADLDPLPLITNNLME